MINLYQAGARCYYRPDVKNKLRLFPNMTPHQIYTSRRRREGALCFSLARPEIFSPV